MIECILNGIHLNLYMNKTPFSPNHIDDGS